MPSDSLDDLPDLPENFRPKLERAIGDEAVVWVGRPDPAVMMKKAIFGILAGGAATLVAVGILGFLVVVGMGDVIMTVVAGVFATVFLLAGVALLLTPVWIKKFATLRAVYVLTRQQALILENKLGNLKVRSFRPAQLQQMELQRRKDGSGSVIMAYDEHQHEHVSYKTREDKGNKHYNVLKEKKETTAVNIKIPVGFLDLTDVAPVDRLVREALHLPPPPSDDAEDDE